MSDEKIKRLTEWIDSPEFAEKLRLRELEELKKAAVAPKCFCLDRCDPPWGDGVQCNICKVRPTGEDMLIVVY